MRFPWQGRTCSRRVLRALVYAVAAPPLAQVPATRSAAERWHRSDGGAPRHAPALRTLARSRGPAPLGRGQARIGPPYALDLSRHFV